VILVTLDSAQLLEEHFGEVPERVAVRIELNIR
jgi:hypothetical protein